MTASKGTASFIFLVCVCVSKVLVRFEIKTGRHYCNRKCPAAVGKVLTLRTVSLYRTAPRSIASHELKRSPEGKRGGERKRPTFHPLRGRERSVFNQTNIGTVSRLTLGETAERRGGARRGLSERYDVILNRNWNWKLKLRSRPERLVGCLNRLDTLRYVVVWHSCRITNALLYVYVQWSKYASVLVPALVLASPSTFYCPLNEPQLHNGTCVRKL